MNPDDYAGSSSLGQLLRDAIKRNSEREEQRSRGFMSHPALNPCGEICIDDRPVYQRNISTLREHYGFAIKPIEISLPTKEHQMTLDIQKLIALADPAWEKDLKELGILSNSVAADELRAEIEAQSKERRSNDIKQAASQILDLGRQVNFHKENLLVELRRIRASEKRLLQEIKDLEAAWDYGSKTLNYLPAALKANLVRGSILFDIPKDLLVVKPLESTEAKPE